MELPCTPPPSESAETTRREADTIRKTRFFEAYDGRQPGDTIDTIAKAQGVNRWAADTWLRQRRAIGIAAYRRTGKHRSGRPKKITDAQVNQLLDNNNPVRTQHYECQMQHFNIHGTTRTLQRALQPRQAQRYKKAPARAISQKNKRERVQYGKEHEGKTVEDFWQYIHFTDEAHIDPSRFFAQEYVLREQGTRHEACNLQEKPIQKQWESLEGAKLHIAASISWHHKSELYFYNDENDHVDIPKKPPRPRRRPTTETEQQYRHRVMEWEANLRHDVEVKPKGNSMTQTYYTENLLPLHIKLVQQARLDRGLSWLQEDNDPSHGTRSTDNMARLLKDRNWVATITHPAQSPDLNPIEAIWNILKQRVRQREWHSLAQLKHLLQEDWERISIEDIRRRIADMPRRCAQLAVSNGAPIKTALW
jgi:transposase